MSAQPAVLDPSPRRKRTPPENRRYANYVLVVLTIVYVFNFIDRQILSILAEQIKADLGLSDASIGFLYGTAFAIFYAIFGIPLARFADISVRKSLISVGLFFWSAMTALSGTARSFTSLAAYRIGVGVGESSASPAAFSMLGDYFPPRLRATAVAVYSSGVYIGAGLGIFLGGWIVVGWNNLFPDGNAPFGLAAWQAAFFIVGLPGILMALWVWTLREPVRGAQEGLASTKPHPHPYRELLREVFAVLPPFTVISLTRAGVGAKGIALNLGIAGACVLGAWSLTTLLGNAPQWIALAIGLYAFFSWVHGLAIRDPGAFSMIYRSRAVVVGIVGFGWLAFVGYGVGFWGAPFFIRVHGISEGQAGTLVGLPAALGGWIGVTGGGLLSDSLKQRNPRARLHVGMMGAALAAPAGILFLITPNLYPAVFFNFLFQIFSSMWIGSAVALSNELVLPRMRATASAYYILTMTFVGLALGPYTIGQLSDLLGRGGADPADALRSGMLAGLGAYALAIVFLWIASRYVQGEEESRLDRARLAGEVTPGTAGTS